MRQRTWQHSYVTKLELARLIGHDAGYIERLTKFNGLPQTRKGRFHLKTSLRFIENHYRNSAEIKISLASVSQQNLAQLLGVTRQTLHDWAAKGLPRNSDGSYDVSVVLKWLPHYYQQIFLKRKAKKLDKLFTLHRAALRQSLNALDSRRTKIATKAAGCLGEICGDISTLANSIRDDKNLSASVATKLKELIAELKKYAEGFEEAIQSGSVSEATKFSRWSREIDSKLKDLLL